MSKERVSKGNKFALLGSKGPHQARRTSLVLSSKKTSLRTQAFLVAMRPGVTPVPIPNTMVKTRTADGTALETVWESRWPPNLKKKERRQIRCRS